MSTATARALLSGLVDYAGLFPPAGLSMEDSAREYARWQASPQAWMLGPFVVPAARLSELWQALPAHERPGPARPRWRLSALLAADVRAEQGLVTQFNAAHDKEALVQSVELRATSPEETESLLDVSSPLPCFVELPLNDASLEAHLSLLARHGARAKVRTGGLTQDSIPSPATLARFLALCAAAGVPFKATAGLHHAVRGTHPLSEAPDGARTVMHGFLNVFAAAVFAHGGASAAEIESVLCEQDPSAFSLGDDALAWRYLRASVAEVSRARARLAVSFGSCSFREPVAELQSLGIVE